MLTRFYRGFQTGLVARFVLPMVFQKSRSEMALSGDLLAKFPVSPLNGRERIWFHAASVGELESLWTVILAWASRHEEVIVTVLSESASDHLRRMREALAVTRCKACFVGYAPWEGEWLEALRKLKPSLFVTAKYEAWPDLWMSLAETRVPLVVVGAKWRRSLDVAKRACRWMNSGLPSLSFLTVMDAEQEDLKKEFPDATIIATGEPRWDRVQERVQRGSPEARSLIERMEAAPRPWGILGSIWESDLSVWQESISKMPGTLWLVPHQVDPIHLSKVENWLSGQGIRYLKSSSLARFERTSARQCILVDEMGFLSELYAVADWAYVGGGFGAGVHSTIEPAIHGIPIACGTKSAWKFAEIDQLSSAGQLTLVPEKRDLVLWSHRIASNGVAVSERTRWKELCQGRMNATRRVTSELEKLARPWGGC